jgi:hypothetical protein
MTFLRISQVFGALNHCSESADKSTWTDRRTGCGQRGDMWWKGHWYGDDVGKKKKKKERR